MPLKWGASVGFTKYTVLVNIHGADGSVLVHHGGVEMGQGINTKVSNIIPPLPEIENFPTGQGLH